jgi:PAS domain S-box-containing protein
VDISNELAKCLLDAAPDPTVIVDQDGTIIYANTQVEEVLGYEANELTDRPVEDLLPQRYRKVHPTHRNSFFASAEPRPMGSGLELFALHKDGHEIPVQISLSPVVTDNGILVLSAFRDISRQKELEGELREASRAKSRFLAAASHDLRQPIQALQLLNRAAKSIATDKTHQAIIEKQQKSLDSMSRLLNSLLDISKLEAGIIRPDVRDCAMQEIFDSLRAEFEEQAKQRGLELVVDRCSDVARSDPRLLTQILENLISNAIRYTHEGVVRLRCLRRALFIRIEVLDTGFGISPDALDEIFEEFHQLDQGSDRPEGLGLGLSIVKRTAGLLNCPLDVSSTPGEGSVFSVTVPQGDMAGLQASGAESTPLSIAVGGRILIVDDEPAVVDATRMLLAVEGFDVLTAASEDEALECVSRSGKTPDLLITDYHLRGGVTGLDVIRSIRDQVHTDVPVILVSGDTSDAIVLDDLKDTGFLTKPVDTDELLTEIRRRIRHS